MGRARRNSFMITKVSDYTLILINFLNINGKLS